MESNRGWQEGPPYQRHRETVMGALGPGLSGSFTFEIYDRDADGLVEIQGLYVDRREYELFMESHAPSHSMVVSVKLAAALTEAVCFTCRIAVRLTQEEACKPGAIRN